jgi:hypothetical protein
MSEGQAAELRGRQFWKRQPRDFPLRVCGRGAGSPRARANQLSKAEADCERKTADYSNSAQRNPVSQPIQHGEKSVQT